MSFYMQKIKDNYYFRIRIPQNLQHHFPYLEIKRSLRTKDPSHAKSLARIWSSKAECVFLTLRSNVLAFEQLQGYIQRELPSMLPDFYPQARCLVYRHSRTDDQHETDQHALCRTEEGTGYDSASEQDGSLGQMTAGIAHEISKGLSHSGQSARTGAKGVDPNPR